jgi:hypothetical protein
MHRSPYLRNITAAWLVAIVAFAGLLALSISETMTAGILDRPLKVRAVDAIDFGDDGHAT